MIFSLKPAAGVIPATIISGGQTGADRGGLEAALKLGIGHGGWCPAGRRAEDGKIPEHYNLRETDSKNYQDRTRRNVAIADATIIFYRGLMGAGSALTARTAAALSKPNLVILASPFGHARAVEVVANFVRGVRPTILNIAGSRESKAPGIQAKVEKILLEALRIA